MIGIMWVTWVKWPCEGFIVTIGKLWDVWRIFNIMSGMDSLHMIEEGFIFILEKLWDVWCIVNIMSGMGSLHTIKEGFIVILENLWGVRWIVRISLSKMIVGWIIPLWWPIKSKMGWVVIENIRRIVIPPFSLAGISTN